MTASRAVVNEVSPSELARVRAVIFDVDGVLLDARPSYHAVAEEAARLALAEVLGEAAARAVPFDRAREVPQFKAAGNFNDDWEMSRAIALLLLLRAQLGQLAPSLPALLAQAGGQGVSGLYRTHGTAIELLPAAAQAAFSPASIARSCGALYGGRTHCRALFGFDAAEALADAPERGLWEREVPLADPALLARVSARFALGLYTGRNPGETRLALLRTQLDVPERLCWVADGRPRKPDPAGLIWLCGELLATAKPAGALALFLGDTADDEAAARAARDARAPLVYAHIEREGDTTRALQALLDATEKTG